MEADHTCVRKVKELTGRRLSKAEVKGESLRKLERRMKLSGEFNIWIW